MSSPASRRRTYTRLGWGELASALVFFVIQLSGTVPALADSRTRPALWCALAPLLLILLQAGVYWLSARSWLDGGHMPAGFARGFRLLRAVDPVLLAAGLAGALAMLPGGGAAVLVLAVWLFGVLEYINYFQVRLSYPATRWLFLVRQWRTPRLVMDLNGSSPTARP